jgi:hypothetical protein
MNYRQNIKYCILLGLSIIFSSCNKYKEILPDIAKIKIIIYVYEDNHIDRENYFIEIADINEIKNVLKYITNIPSPMYKCGYNGKMEFICKKNNILLETEFNIDCNTIVFVYNDKLYTRRISNMGIEHIRNIIKDITEKYNKKVL